MRYEVPRVHAHVLALTDAEGDLWERTTKTVDGKPVWAAGTPGYDRVECPEDELIYEYGPMEVPDGNA